MSVEDALTRLSREESGRVLALLAGRLGDLDLADEAVQDALVEAVRTWPTQGVPDNPAGWLMTVARRKALDRIRRTTSARRRVTAAAYDLLEAVEPASDRGLVEKGAEQMEITDEHLRLVLLCCHPALNQDAQVALTLRLVGGLSTAEIAAAYVVPEATITQRVVRAKRKIRDAAIPLSIPAALTERVEALLTVLYLIFNEGYLSRSSADLVRVDLADEAIRLTRLAHDLLPDSGEVGGLLALELYQRARFATRVDGAGELVLLEHQDRTRWDRDQIAEANRVLAAALADRTPGTFRLQAVIAAQHANARTYADTDWPAIAAAYARLDEHTGSAIVRLNRAVAVAEADGPHAGLRLLDTVEGLDDFHLLHATRAELLSRAGDPDAARTAFARARSLTDNPAEQRFLDGRIAAQP
ncbi:RNA polymerase sigma factor [Nocardioides conyzicola]|uniref:Sigma-70 family RNA polymerase sigma factor n=1 Tax=Nocardioides conyzicola TaxID=1651781 RepID=A0ABP8WZ01_9ACTN